MGNLPEHHTEHVLLPSGKTIDVIYFGDRVSAHQGQGLRRDAPRAPAPELHVCQNCASRLVYPVQWEAVSDTHWEILLRCPDCECFIAGVFDQDTAERFDHVLDRGAETLVDDLRRLTVANMEEEIDRFSAALRDDLILPEDF